MDDIVRQALAKWPNVPACYGWLGLDARGGWHMRDDRVQALGGFASGVPGAKGSVLRHDKLVDFIGRNYEATPDGQWFFQNGPQRVYVELEVTPWVMRVGADFSVATHTGRPAQARNCLVDEHGRGYGDTAGGGVVVPTREVAGGRRLFRPPPPRGPGARPQPVWGTPPPGVPRHRPRAGSGAHAGRGLRGRRHRAGPVDAPAGAGRRVADTVWLCAQPG